MQVFYRPNKHIPSSHWPIQNGRFSLNLQKQLADCYIYIMSLIRRIVFTFQILLLALLTLNGQTDLRFENYYLEDGLPHSRTRQIFQDRIGWIWAGTAGGLSRFDGTSFKTYPLANASGEESTSSIICFGGDSDSVIWIGTEHDGLAFYDRRLDRFESFSRYDSSNNCISSNEVHSITSDSSGIMWIGTSGGLNRFDPFTKSFQWIRHQSSHSPSLSGDTVSKVFIDRDNRLWIGTHRGLDYLDLESGQITNVSLFAEGQSEPLAGNRIEDISQDERGNILVASYYNGLFVIDSSLRKSVNIIPEADYQRSYLVRSVFPDQNGSLWLGTRGGIYVLDQNFKVAAHYTKSLQDQNSLGHNSIRDIFKDRSGDIWIAHRSGVSHANLKSMAFKYYMAIEGDDHYLNDPEVYTIYQSKDGRIWLGTEAGGVNILDNKSKRFTYLTHDEYNSNTICSNCIKTIIQDKKGNFWLGSFLEGLDYYNVKQNRFIHYKHDPEDKNSLSNNSVWALHEDGSGDIWIGTDEGLDRFDPDNEQFHHYRIGPKNIPVHTISEDRAGNLFFGSDNGILAVMKPGSVLSEFEIPARVIFEDSKGRIWIGSETSDGLKQFHLQKGIIKTYTMADGLPSNQVYGILEDDSSKLWLSTGQGLCRFDPETDKFKSYKAEDGIQGDRFYYGSYYKLNSGELLFGGQNGLTSFDPDHLSEDYYIPPVVITDFKIFNKEVPIGANSKES